MRNWGGWVFRESGSPHRPLDLGGGGCPAWFWTGTFWNNLRGGPLALSSGQTLPQPSWALTPSAWAPKVVIREEVWVTERGQPAKISGFLHVAGGWASRSFRVM